MLPVGARKLTDVMIHKIGLFRFQKEANGLHPVSTGFPVARRCVREVDIRVHDYRAAGRTMIRQRIEI